MLLKKDRDADKIDCDDNDASELQTGIDALMLKKNRRLTNEHRFSYAEEKAKIPSRKEISKILNVIMAKFDAEGSEKQQQLAKTNEHGFILIQSMYQCF